MGEDAGNRELLGTDGGNRKESLQIVTNRPVEKRASDWQLLGLFSCASSLSIGLCSEPRTLFSVCCSSVNGGLVTPTPADPRPEMPHVYRCSEIHCSGAEWVPSIFSNTCPTFL